MDYSLALLIVFTGAGGVFFSALFLNEWRKRRRFQAIQSLPFSKEYLSIVSKIPHYTKLTPDELEKLHRLMLCFIHSKEYVGVSITITDEIKVVIAFYACLLILYRSRGDCYENLKTIIVYPSSVLVDTIRSSGGIYAKERFVIEGQSTDETVVITWHEAKRESYHMRHNNVIIHEFTHEIDFMDGQIDGIPPIEYSKYDGWVNTLYREYETINTIANKNRNWGKYKILGSYAATNPAEFFAVVTERFFESPASLKHHFPELYREMASFYGYDAAERFDG